SREAVLHRGLRSCPRQVPAVARRIRLHHRVPDRPVVRRHPRDPDLRRHQRGHEDDHLQGPGAVGMYPGRYAAVAPDRPAVHEAATGRTLTYRELEDASVRFAHWLRAHDVGRGDHIAVVTVNDATAFELYW